MEKATRKKFLFISYDGYIGDLAWYVAKEGNQVKYYIDNETQRDVANGFVEKTNDWKKEVDWADVIIFDDVLGFGAASEDLRKKGKAVIGGTRYTDKLEDDRTFGQEEMKKAGIQILPFAEFTSFDDAIKFIEKNPGKYVLKPSGEAQNFKELLYVGEEENGKDLIEVLRDYKKIVTTKIDVFQLQKRAEGVEIGVGAFFNGKNFIYPININFEHKRLFPGNIGPFTGEMGTSMFWSNPNMLFNRTLKKMEPMLAEDGYVGYIDINCIINAQGIYPLEFTARFGYPTISIQIEGIKNTMGQFLYDLACGKDPKLKVKNGFQIGVRIVVPPFPFYDPEIFKIKSKDSIVFFKKSQIASNINIVNPDNENQSTEENIYGFNNLNGIHIEDIKILNGEWVITGTTGLALIVCGSGQTMKQAQTQAYFRIKNVNIPNMYYRRDIGNRWEDERDKLNTWGYLKEE